jgi:hypothetical protein
MALVTPNRIVLISRGRHDEALASATCYPGMGLVMGSNLQVQPYNVAGGGGPVLIAEEDALQGGDATQPLPSGYNIPFRRTAKGDMMLLLLQFGQSVVPGNPLMCAGDGSFAQGPAGYPTLYQITAPSAVITNTAVETAYSNGSYTFPANFFQAGDRVKIHLKTFLISVNSTNTHQEKLYLGVTPITLADSTALAMIANDVVVMDLSFSVRTVGVTGSITAEGTVARTVSGTWTSVPLTVNPTTFDTTQAETLVLKSTASAASPTNQIRLDEFSIELSRGGGISTIAVADDTINNTTGTGSNPMSMFSSTTPAGFAAFCRAIMV